MFITVAFGWQLAFKWCQMVVHGPDVVVGGGRDASGGVGETHRVCGNYAKP